MYSNHNLNDMLEISDNLKSIGINKIIFTGPTPRWTPALPVIVAYRLWEDTPKKTKLGLDANILDLDRHLTENFPQSKEVRYVSIIDSLCDSTGCTIYLGDDKKTGITSIDFGHLSFIASIYFVKNNLISEIIK